jgi:hypothetical protein
MMVWLMLLAIPVQGFASATMLLCEPIVASASASATPGPHDHAAMLAAQSSDTPDQPASSGQHTAAKCSACAAFCLGVVMMTSTQSVLPMLDLPSQHTAVALSLLPSVVPDHPERPPQTSLA